MGISLLKPVCFLGCICLIGGVAIAQPSITINQASGQADPTNAVPVHFTMGFNQNVTGFDASDISFAGSTVTLQAPTITCPSDFTVGAGAPFCSASIDFANAHPAIVTGTPAPTVSYSIKNDNTQAVVTTSTSTSLPIGEYTVTATATNSVGTASCSFKISVIAGTFPISCPEDYTIETIDPQCVAYILLTSGEHAVDYYFPPNLSFTWADDKGNTGSTAGVFVAPPGIYTITATAVECGVQTNSCSYVVTVIPKAVMITCLENISLVDENNDCQEEITLLGNLAVTTRNSISTIYKWVDANGNSGSVSKGPFGGAPPPFTFPVGVNTIKVIANGCGDAKDSCTFTVTVTESEPPVISKCASDVTVSCAADIPDADINEIIATDNCGTPVITHVGDVISEQTCANKFKLTRTYMATDVSGNKVTCSQTITVDDKAPPTITGLTPSKKVLAPPNHKMADITLAYTIYDNCISTSDVTINITSNEPVNGTSDGDTDPDWEIIDGHNIRLRAERAGNGTGRIYTITVTVSDGCNAPVSATTEVRVAHNITGPPSGNSFKVGSTVALTGEFWDVPNNSHTAKWLIDGSTTTKATVTEPVGGKNGKVTGSYKFTTPGVYKLQMNVTDQKGVTTYANTNGDLEAIVVIYDPNGGHTYGGGYYNSPAGALLSNQSSTGKASYGFAMNYFKNSTNPKGETQFDFKVGDFEFNALKFDYLVISNSMAQFKGTGKIIGGQSGIGFTMTVVDGELDGTGIDKIRMKIYNKNNGQVIYDNQPGASDAILPTQAVGANSTIVINGKNSSNVITANTGTGAQARSESIPLNISRELKVMAFPNPTTNNFSITVQADPKEKILMQVLDMYGRVIETRNVTANSIVRFGDRYRPGTYLVKVIQGKEHKEIKLVKLSD